MWTINFHFTDAVFRHLTPHWTAGPFFSGLFFILKTVDSLKNSCCIFVMSENPICISIIFYFWLSTHKICSCVVLYFQTINSTMTTTFWQTHYHWSSDVRCTETVLCHTHSLQMPLYMVCQALIRSQYFLMRHNMLHVCVIMLCFVFIWKFCTNNNCIAQYIC